MPLMDHGFEPGMQTILGRDINRIARMETYAMWSTGALIIPLGMDSWKWQEGQLHVLPLDVCPYNFLSTYPKLPVGPMCLWMLLAPKRPGHPLFQLGL